MKNLTVVAALTITILAASSVFVHFSYNLTAAPPSADSLNSYLVKREKELSVNFRHYKEEVLGNWKTSFEMNENVTAFDLQLKKHCSAICPLAMVINHEGVKAVGMFRERY